MKSQKVVHFDDYETFREQLLQDLSEDTDRTPAEVQEAVESYPMPDPEDLQTVPAEEFYSDS